MSTSKSNFWSSPLTKSRITSDGVKMPEMLLGYFIGPFGALLSSGIFTSILQNYFTDVLKLDLGFLTTLQLVSTVLIVASDVYKRQGQRAAVICCISKKIVKTVCHVYFIYQIYRKYFLHTPLPRV